MSYIIAINFDKDSQMATVLCQSEQKMNQSFTLVKSPISGAGHYIDDENNIYSIFDIVDNFDEAKQKEALLRELYMSVM